MKRPPLNLLRRSALPLLFLCALAACGGGDPAAPEPGAMAPVTDLEVVAGSENSVTLAWTVPGASPVYDLRYVRLGEETADRSLWTMAPRRRHVVGAVAAGCT